MIIIFLTQLDYQVISLSVVSMMKTNTPVESESLINGRKSPEGDEKTYGSVVGISPDEEASRASYAEYHKVCDMRYVIDTSAVGCAGIILTFLMVFASWCAWHETIEWIGTVLKFENVTPVKFSAIVNAVTVVILVGLVLLMRYIIGPILSLSWRAVFATLLVMIAISIWEALEATIDILVGSDARDRAVFYLIAFASTVLIMFVFEKVFRYDVIGNHLLVPA